MRSDGRVVERGQRLGEDQLEAVGEFEAGQRPEAHVDDVGSPVDRVADARGDLVVPAGAVVTEHANGKDRRLVGDTDHAGAVGADSGDGASYVGPVPLAVTVPIGRPSP